MAVTTPLEFLIIFKTSLLGSSPRNSISEFHEFGIPLLLGPSKKSFLSNVTRGEFLNFEERDIPCTVVSSFALWRGGSILRYHEVNQGRHLIDTIELMKRNLK